MNTQRRTVLVGMGTCGLSAGAQEVYNQLKALSLQHPEAGTVALTGCIGLCYREPLVEIREGAHRVIFGGVDERAARELFSRYVLGTEALPDEGANIVYVERPDGTVGGTEAPVLSRQVRIVLANCGLINPELIEEYEAQAGYTGLKKALFELTPKAIIEEVKASGLRGRGGAGFPTGLKWSFVAEGDHKYVVCNADEGDPGAFMDRSVLEGDPHAVIEGMIICARAIGANHGYIYCRAEYPLAIHRLQIALKQARAKGYLGKDILGSGFDFDVKIKQGAGAFVCGEETALFASIEGQRGMPRIRPPFPAVKGLFQKPTNNNNVETFANVPWILRNGAKAYTAHGTEKSPGTKVFALAGKVKRGGLAEVPMGTTIRELVFELGGGIQNDRGFKAVQMGGPSGGCIPAALADTPVAFETIPATGAIMGSGGMVVLDDTACMVEIARFFLEFTQSESCGKCTFCRVGTLRMLEVLTRLTQGEGQPGDLEKLELLASRIKEASLCGLGQTAPNPVLTTLRYYRSEYEAHLHDQECPARYCAALVEFKIDANRCSGCSLCLTQCPSHAITGSKRQAHTIDTALCTKCGKCVSVCNIGAVYKA